MKPLNQPTTSRYTTDGTVYTGHVAEGVRIVARLKLNGEYIIDLVDSRKGLLSGRRGYHEIAKGKGGWIAGNMREMIDREVEYRRGLMASPLEGE